MISLANPRDGNYEDSKAMSLVIENLPEAIRSSKASLRKALPNYSEVFHEVEAEMRRKIAQIAIGGVAQAVLPVRVRESDRAG